MNKEYKALFVNITITAETIAEQAMAIHKDEKKVTDYGRAKEMRETFRKLTDKIKKDETLTKKDYAMISIACSLVIARTNSQIEIQKKAVEGYNNIIQKLNKLIIVDDDKLEEAEDKLFNSND